MGNAYPAINTKGDVSEIVVSFTDVTNVKQDERALRKSGKRLHLVWPRLKGRADGRSGTAPGRLERHRGLRGRERS